ncbi:MAG: DUF2202 domain-containing protein, partial [Hydrogenimonas sp.]|nr:DUF2202 domain-containing protein [Hydrogenimonas sp.]
MKKSHFAAMALGAFLFAGCGSDSTTASVDGYDITVERGPVLHAVVIDQNGNQAREIGKGVYRFANAPKYPVTAAGGFIDIDRDGTVSAGDVNNTLIIKGSEGVALTLLNSVSLNSDVREWLKSEFNITDDTINNYTPSKDREVAAISDELYAYCIENNISDPATLRLQNMQNIREQIQARIDEYLQSSTATQDLEDQLVTELQIERLDEVDISDIQNSLGGMGGLESAILSIPENNLTQEQVEIIAYMWSEEKMAKDLYLALNDLFPHIALENIALKAETKHQATIETLAMKYDINVTNPDNNYSGGYSTEDLARYAIGEFPIDDIQNLYDTLYQKGQNSQQEALEVGCIVEVTDVEDLDRDIELSKDAEDLQVALSSLRSGSYNHYWAFDR